MPFRELTLSCQDESKRVQVNVEPSNHRDRLQCRSAALEQLNGENRRTMTNYAAEAKKAADGTVVLSQYGGSTAAIGVPYHDALHRFDEYSLFPFG